MTPKHAKDHERWLQFTSNLIYFFIGCSFALCAIGISVISIYEVVIAITTPASVMGSLLNLVSRLIISVAIFDVGRYLIEEEVLRDRQLRSPIEARKSLTKFMVIIVIAVTLEALISIIKVTTTDFKMLWAPALLVLAAVSLLLGLGGFQRLSVLTETAAKDEEPND